MSHLRGRAHQEAALKASADPLLTSEQVEAYNLRQIIDAPAGEEDPRERAARERGKAHKKRCKKIRQRMASKGAEFESNDASAAPPDCPGRRTLVRDVNLITSIAGQAAQGLSPSSYAQLDRSLNELARLLAKDAEADLVGFRAASGFNALAKLMSLGQAEHHPLASKFVFFFLWELRF